MTSERVVVTGTGVVSPLGRSRGALMDALLAGRSGDGAVTRFDAARECGRTKNLKYMSRASALAVAAARSAIAESGLELDDARGEELACHVALGMTSSELGELARLVQVSTGEDGRLSLALVGERGIRATNPLISFKILSNMPLCHVALATRARGPNAALLSLGGETLSVLAGALHDVLEGRARFALFGAVDAQLERAGVVQLAQRGLLSSSGPAGRPFCATSGGRVLAEAAAFLVLEREADARARGAKILGSVALPRLASAGGVSLATVGSEALAAALVGSEVPAAVLASACGDPQGDAAEAAALAASSMHRAPVSATRGALGDSLAAGPALDLVVALGALERRALPPISMLERPLADAAKLDLVRGAPRALEAGPVLVVAGGIGSTVGTCLVEAAS